MSKSFDVAAVGNAIVDVIAPAEDAFIETEGLLRGAMGLIDEERAQGLYAAMAPGLEASGGSAANTTAGVASLGGRAAFIGARRDRDALRAQRPARRTGPAITSGSQERTRRRSRNCN